MSNTHLKKLEAYTMANLEAARIVAADPERYPGLMQEWASAVLTKAGAMNTDERELRLWEGAA